MHKKHIYFFVSNHSEFEGGQIGHFYRKTRQINLATPNHAETGK